MLLLIRMVSSGVVLFVVVRVRVGLVDLRFPSFQRLTQIMASLAALLFGRVLEKTARAAISRADFLYYAISERPCGSTISWFGR